MVSMSTPDKALLALLIFFGVIFGLIILGKLIFLVMFICEMATRVHWIAIPLGAIGLCYLICVALACQLK